jgi:hypothetical protein
MSSRFSTLLATVIACSPLLLHAQAPVGELFSTAAEVRGSVALAGGGTTILSGSSISAGSLPAKLNLNRGGNLTICSGTSVAVSSSANGQNLMFSFGSGTIESRYSMNASSDLILTPDLRFVVTGPGEFDLDVGISNNGDTCVHSARNSTGGVIVSELMGDGTYQIKPADFVVFRTGRVTNADINPLGVSCGCPVPKQTSVAKAEPAPSRPAPAPSLPSSLQQPLAWKPPATQEHVEVDAPFVFNADRLAPAPTARVMQLRVESKNSFRGFHPEVQPPPARPKKKGSWRKFMSALFSGR